MKILHRQIVNNLSVGLIPLFLVISIIFIVNRRQTQRTITRQMSDYIENFKTLLDADLSKFRDYAYFIGAESRDFIVNGRFTTADFPVNVERFDMRMYEVFWKDRLLYRDLYSWQDAIYFAPPHRATYIWEQLYNREYSIFFTMSYPEILSNTLVIRNAALLTKETFLRAGFVSVVSPLDMSYLNKIPFVNQDVILFIQTPSNVTFSDQAFNQTNIINKLMKYELGRGVDREFFQCKSLGAFYMAKQVLYSQREKVSNRFVQNNLADVGVLFRAKAANREFLLYRRVIFIILLLALLVFPVIAWISGKRISSPLYGLIEQVDRFKKDFTMVKQPAQITDEISLLQQSFSEMSHTVIQKSEDLSVALTELALANEDLAALTVEDSLTGVKNRRFFNNKIENEIKRATRLNETLSLLMVDIDYFKKVNDNYGHEAGDECLKQVARILKKHANRSGDAVTRYGGEEFSIILPNTDRDGAYIVAEKIRKDMDNTPIVYRDQVIHITLSVGVAGFTAREAPESLANIISHADAALYQAKESGRNRVVVFQAAGESIPKKSARKSGRRRTDPESGSPGDQR